MKNDSFDFNQILQSTNEINPVSVDDSLFYKILDKAKEEQLDNSLPWINTSQLKYIAAAVVLLVTVNVFSILKFSKNEDWKPKTNASEQLVTEYYINR